jgi:hypothetical protein
MMVQGFDCRAAYQNVEVVSVLLDKVYVGYV